MCKGSRTWIDRWGEVKYKRLGWDAPNIPFSNDKREKEAIAETEADIRFGKFLSEINEAKEVKEGRFSIKEAKENKEPVYYRLLGDSTAFFLPYGNNNCKPYSTEFCRKYCYARTLPFINKELQKEIQSVDIKNYDTNLLLKLVNESESEYFTFFASGCIEKIPNWQDFTKTISLKNRNKKFRFFIRNWEQKIPALPKNSIIILSIDNSTVPHIIIEILIKNISKNIKCIAIVDHEENSELIKMLKNDVTLKNLGCQKVINCKDCKENDWLCFNQDNRFILIQKFLK